MRVAVPNSAHVPILIRPIVQSLIEPYGLLPKGAPAHCIVDCTLGGGGHTLEFLRALDSRPEWAKHKVMAFDQDAGAIERARVRFSREIEQGRLLLVHARFSDAAEYFRSDLPVLGLLADLGFSSDQLEDPARGLSFQKEGPLDMRLDPSRGQTCRDFLFQVSEKELEDILSEFGEERFSRRIAGAIIQSRRAGSLPKTTRELAELVLRTVPPPARHGRIHAATRTFQALRIAVNEELKELDRLLEHVILGVKTGGRVAILSFHSLEDRRVKHAFRSYEKEERFRALTKKPIEADDAEVGLNPRSRSAKLRLAERLGERG